MVTSDGLTALLLWKLAEEVMVKSKLLRFFWKLYGKHKDQFSL
jgi:hypothetical protein